MARRVAARWAAWERRAGRFGAAPSAGTASPTPSADTFPTTDLQCRVWIALTPDYTKPWWQWGWANITEYVRWDPGISVSDGRRDESGTVSTINASMVLENDGRFSRHNAFGAYYPHLTRNTPIWAQVNPGSGWYDRLHGYVNAWPKRWDTTGTDSVVPVSIGGIMRRLEQDAVLRPPMHGIQAADSPIGQWALDDGSTATVAASSLPNGIPMTPLGVVTFGATTGPDGGPGPLVDLSSGSLIARVDGTVSTGWAYELIVNVVEGATDGVLASLTLGQSTCQILTQTTLLPLAIYESFPAGTQITQAAARDTGFSGAWHHLMIKCSQDGTTVAMQLWYDGTLIASSSSGGSQDIPASFRINAPYPGSSTGLQNMSAGFAAVYLTNDVDAADRYQAMLGWIGELATTRIARVCSEAGVPFYGADATSTTLGVQPAGTLLDVLRDAEKADRGVLYEYQFGFGYKPPRSFYNQPVDLPLDQAAGQLAESVEADDDDQNFVNQWTASRTSGSSSTFRDPAYQTGDALFAGGDTYNVETDEQLPHIAGWEVHKGTVDEDRWPMLAIDLANHPELIPDWTAMPFGGRVQVTSPHDQVGIDLIDAIREGRSEHWNSKQWNARMNTTPASVHTVAVYDGGLSRYGASDSSLSAAVSSSDTSWTVAPGGDTWATSASHPDVFPIDIDAGGVTYSCTAITGAVTDTFTRSVTDGWGSADTGQAWTLSGGTNPGNYDVTGTQGTHTLDSVNVRRHSLLDTSATDFDVFVDVTLPVVPTGAAITLWLAGRVADTSNYYAAYLSVATSGTVTLAIAERVAAVSADLVSATAGTHSASDTWRIRFQGTGRQLAAKAWNVTAGSAESDGWLVETWDGSLTTGTSVGLLSRLETGNTNGTVTVSWDALNTVLAPLTFTVVRLATDKAHAAGTAVTVTDTGVYGI